MVIANKMIISFLFLHYGTCCGLSIGLERAQVIAETQARGTIFPAFTFHWLVEQGFGRRTESRITRKIKCKTLNAYQGAG